MGGSDGEEGAAPRVRLSAGVHGVVRYALRVPILFSTVEVNDRRGWGGGKRAGYVGGETEVVLRR